MLLQVHDELVFDLHKSEEKEMRTMVEDKMKMPCRILTCR